MVGVGVGQVEVEGGDYGGSPWKGYLCYMGCACAHFPPHHLLRILGDHKPKSFFKDKKGA